MTRRYIPTWAAAAVLGLATHAALAADDPEASLSAELRKQHPLPAKLKLAAGDDAVRKLLIARHNALRDEFYHLLSHRDSPKHDEEMSRLMELPRKLAELQVELEPDARRRLVRLEPLVVTAKAIEEFHRGRVRMGQERPQIGYRATAERLGVEALLVRARLTAGLPVGALPPARLPEPAPGPDPPRADGEPPQAPPYVLPMPFNPGVAGDPARALLAHRHFAVVVCFELEVVRRMTGTFKPTPQDPFLPLVKELAELHVELESDPRRLVKDLELLAKVAKRRAEDYEVRVKTGQAPPHWGLWAEADRLEVETHLAKARKALKP